MFPIWFHPWLLARFLKSWDSPPHASYSLPWLLISMPSLSHSSHMSSPVADCTFLFDSPSYAYYLLPWLLDSMPSYYLMFPICFSPVAICQTVNVFRFSAPRISFFFLPWLLTSMPSYISCFPYVSSRGGCQIVILFNSPPHASYFSPVAANQHAKLYPKFPICFFPWLFARL